MNEYVETVQHMIDWIEKNLDQAKVLESLLREIGYSPWYCSVLFHDVIQKTLKSYVSGRRLARATEGFDVIDLPECGYLMFQGEPFNEEDYEEAIGAMWDAEKKYDPSVIGVKWDGENPRIQLEPRGERGYIELLAVKGK